MDNPLFFQLTDWQTSFVDQFVSRTVQRSLLVAPAGTGKTATALAASQKLIEAGAIDSVLIISDHAMIRDHWRDVASRFGMELQTSLDRYLHSTGITTTSRSLKDVDLIDAAAISRRWLIVSDEAKNLGAAAALVDRMLQSNAKSRALIISRVPQTDNSFDAEFSFSSETFLSPIIIAEPATQLRIVTYSPSVALLQRLRNRGATIDDLSWREFETVIATLLEEDGYTVELTRGTKDGGVDVIAIKDLGPNGYFKALWQAKKQSVKNKVGISVIRELADTRQEFGASKGIIVTSSLLTRGALERIDRDKYLLGKVDRNELQTWINKTLLYQNGN